jgi:hypothetical protein
MKWVIEFQSFINLFFYSELFDMLLRTVEINDLYIFIEHC